MAHVGFVADAAWQIFESSNIVPLMEPRPRLPVLKMATTSSKPFSISLSSSKSKLQKPPPPSSNPRKRPHSALADPDSDHEEHSHPQLVTGFDQSNGGAVSIVNTIEKAPLVIKPQKNRDWREESRRKRGKNLLPTDAQVAKDNPDGTSSELVVERDEVSKEAGLKCVHLEQDGDTVMTNGHPASVGAQQEPEKEQTADEEAIEALLGREKKSTLVIPATVPTPNGHVAQGSEELEDYLNEDDRFKADVASRPDSCSLEEYIQIPVEEFGAAMLRGMVSISTPLVVQPLTRSKGWKEGQSVGRNINKAHVPRKVERRPALLGIGAKEVPDGVREELGAWGKAAKGKKKVDMAYSPVMLRNPQTGEMLTEEELEKKLLGRRKGKDEEDWRDRRDRNLTADNERKKERLAIEDGKNGNYRRRDRSRSKERRRNEGLVREDGRRSNDRSRHSSSQSERSRSGERSRHSSSRRDRSRSRDMKRDRRHHDDSDRRRKDYDRYDKGYRRR